jgi:hypothetical protein
MSSEEPKLIAIKRILLGPQHLSPGRTVHRKSDSKGVRPFPPFKSLEIAHYPNAKGFYLFHICADGQGTDTWHESLEDALHQAEFEFAVKPDEWEDIHEIFGESYNAK